MIFMMRAINSCMVCVEMFTIQFALGSNEFSLPRDSVFRSCIIQEGVFVTIGANLCQRLERTISPTRFQFQQKRTSRPGQLLLGEYMRQRFSEAEQCFKCIVAQCYMQALN